MRELHGWSGLPGAHPPLRAQRTVRRAGPCVMAHAGEEWGKQGEEVRKPGEAGGGVDVGAHFTAVSHGSGRRHRCNHCRKVVSAKRPSECKTHMARCTSLPRGVREVLDHAAVCDSRAGVGRFSGANAAVYRKFRVTGELVASCSACGVEVRGPLGHLKKHLDGRCAGIKVAWTEVDVGAYFTAVPGGSDRHRCNHCRKVVAGKDNRKPHMARCASLPRGVREALDHAAVCDGRAGVSRFCGANASCVSQIPRDG